MANYYVSIWRDVHDSRGYNILDREPTDSLESALALSGNWVVARWEHNPVPYSAGVHDGQVYYLSLNQTALKNLPGYFVCRDGAKTVLIEHEICALGAIAEERAEGNNPAPLRRINAIETES